MIFLLASLATPVPTSEVVVVRAERLRATVSPQTTLTGADLGQTSGVRLDEALRLVPGIGLFRRTSSGAANATIQGLSLRPIAPNGAGRALVTLDDVPQNDPFGGWVHWGRYNPLFISQIDVKRGGAGAGYGPMALTGTLDLTESRAQPHNYSASLGSYGTLAVAGRASVSSQNAVFTAMAAFETSDGAFGIARQQQGAADLPINYQSTSFTLVTDIARDNGAWSFRGSGFLEEKGAGLVGAQSSSEGLDVSAARRFEGDWGQARFLIYAQGRNFSNQTVAVTARRTTTIPTLNQFATPSSAVGGSIAFEPNDTRSRPSLRLEWRRTDGQTRELFRYIGSDFTRARTAGGAQDTIGVSAALPRSIELAVVGLALDGIVRADFWKNSNGIRRETDRALGNSTLSEQAGDRSGTVLTGAVSLAQQQGPLRVSVYRTFRPPTLNELHRPFRVGNDITEANAALMPETLMGIDVELRHRWALPRANLVTAVTFYANRLDDPIANVTIASGPGTFPRIGFLPAGGSLRERRNVGRIDATGIEASLRWNSKPDAPAVYVSGSWTEARVNGGSLLPQLTGKRPGQAPSWSMVASLKLPVTETLSVNTILRGESQRYEDDLNSRELAAYGVADVKIEWQLNPMIDVFFSCENLWDTTVPTARTADGIVSLTQGRAIRIGVSLSR